MAKKKQTNNKKGKAEAKASAKPKQTDEEWLEEELGDDADKLMAEAAEKIKKLEADLKEWNDKYLRLHAEWDTYRRRTAEQREQDRATATEDLVTDMLPVLDDFERSIAYANTNGEKGLLEGIEAVYTKLGLVLKKHGAEVINPAQFEAFNALEHQAVSTVENKDEYDESVANVLQKGFKMGSKVIRPATVVVTTGGDPRPKEEEDEEN
ncbi:MAG: nucleotide exchange factor GrpE [Coriobacteriia bacterium]|nr:nucleotide exchange factor GrpE [Coriobacteriia bacterium]